MTPRKSASESEAAGTPRAPEGTPLQYTHPDQHSFMLQSIMEMRESLGGLKQAVHDLSEQSRANNKKVQSLSHQIYAAGAVVAAIGILLGFLAPHFWDFAVSVFQLVNAKK
jgi:hypothetical protein